MLCTNFLYLLVHVGNLGIAFTWTLIKLSFTDPEWVNLDGFAVLSGAPVNSAGKLYLKGIVTEN